jgi:hypothetical protein
MSEDIKESRRSFRRDKQMEGVDLPKNQFGHTLSVLKEDEIKPVDQLVQSESGILSNHVDIFESPHLKKFMNEYDLDVTSHEEAEEIDLSEDLSDEPKNYRPETLEDFENYSDNILGKVQPQRNNTIFRKEQKIAEAHSFKNCQACQSKIKKDAKFCSECGTPQIQAQFCKNCGNKFDGGEKFCSECGTKRE